VCERLCSTGTMDRLQLTMIKMKAVGSKIRGHSQKRTENSSRSQQAPHPIPKGKEGLPCPVTMLFADENNVPVDNSAAAALAELEADPDIAEERKTFLLAQASSETSILQSSQLSSEAGIVQALPAPIQLVPLNVRGQSHKASHETRSLVRAIGGLPMLRRFTGVFYKKCFADPHVDQFIRKHTDPHGERFACWIAEKLGDGTPWTDERKHREHDTMKIGNQVHEVAYDRSSAHAAAWNSPKREPHKQGQRFQPEDARVWIRLHFWSMREVGLFEPQHAAFMDYYTRFIGHFISVYSGKSPPFTRESARWSEDAANIEKYRFSGNLMTDVINKPLERALSELPANERVYSGSSHLNPSWPYGTPV